MIERTLANARRSSPVACRMRCALACAAVLLGLFGAAEQRPGGASGRWGPPQAFGAIDDTLDAVCRITAPDGSRGSGCAFERSGGRVYVLTAAHVVGSFSTVWCEFWRQGRPGARLPGKVAFAHGQADAAVVAVDESAFTEALPRTIAPAAPDRPPPAGTPITSAGCAQGGWPTAFQGVVVDLLPGELCFIPPPANGRSGSPLLDAQGRAILGVIRARTADNATGIATPIARVHQAFARQTHAVPQVYSHYRPSEIDLWRSPRWAAATPPAAECAAMLFAHAIRDGLSRAQCEASRWAALNFGGTLCGLTPVQCPDGVCPVPPAAPWGRAAPRELIPPHEAIPRRDSTPRNDAPPQRTPEARNETQGPQPSIPLPESFSPRRPGALPGRPPEEPSPAAPHGAPSPTAPSPTPPSLAAPSPTAPSLNAPSSAAPLRDAASQENDTAAIARRLDRIAALLERLCPGLAGRIDERSDDRADARRSLPPHTPDAAPGDRSDAGRNPSPNSLRQGSASGAESSPAVPSSGSPGGANDDRTAAMQELLRALVGDPQTLLDRVEARLEKLRRQSGDDASTAELARRYARDYAAEKLADGALGWTAGKWAAAALGLSGPLSLALAGGLWLVGRRVARRIEQSEPLIVERLWQRISQRLGDWAGGSAAPAAATGNAPPAQPQNGATAEGRSATASHSGAEAGYAAG